MHLCVCGAFFFVGFCHLLHRALINLCCHHESGQTECHVALRIELNRDCPVFAPASFGDCAATRDARQGRAMHVVNVYGMQFSACVGLAFDCRIYNEMKLSDAVRVRADCRNELATQNRWHVM